VRGTQLSMEEAAAKERKLQQALAELTAEMHAAKEEISVLSASVGEWQRTAEVQAATAADVHDRMQRELQDAKEEHMMFTAALREQHAQEAEVARAAAATAATDWTARFEQLDAELGREQEQVKHERHQRHAAEQATAKRELELHAAREQLSAQVKQAEEVCVR
jgi:hypothetical protein